MNIQTHVAIVCEGRAGMELGRAWSALGYRIIYGVPGVADGELRAARAAADAPVATVRAAVSRADIVVLSVPAARLDEILAQAGSLDGKIVIAGAGRARGAGASPTPAQLQERLPGANVLFSLHRLRAGLVDPMAEAA